MFNSALERAREATDAANERAAKAEILTMYMLDEPLTVGGTDKVVATTKYDYNAATGKLEAAGTTTTLKYGKCATHKGQYIKVSIDTSNVVTVEWSTSGSTDLCMEKVTNK